jgi:hypothetical protein
MRGRESLPDDEAGYRSVVEPPSPRYVVEVFVPADAGLAEAWRARLDQILRLPTRAPEFLLAMPSIEDRLEGGEQLVRLRWIELQAKSAADAVQQGAAIFEGLFSPMITPTTRIRVEAWAQED